MKRSRSLSLILMGSLTLAAAGCSSENREEGMYTFSSVNECISSGIFDEAQCRQLAAEAARDRPRFQTREECEAQFGADACVGSDAPAGATVEGGSGSFWMPMLAGFLAGRFLGNGGMMHAAQGLYRNPASAPQGTPSYRTVTGDVVKPGPGGRVGDPTPRMIQTMQHQARPALGRSGVGTRGGFSGGFSGGRASS